MFLSNEDLSLMAMVLIIPVVSVLLFLFGWSLLELGGFARECVGRRRRRRNWTEFAEGLIRAGKANAAAAARRFFDRTDYPGFVGIFARDGARLVSDSAHLEKQVVDIEIEASHAQLRMNLGIRLGPALGLIGTLIPMGPALMSLSSGDVGGVGSHLAVAFSTTILGLATSAICYFISIGRRHWYAQDLADIDHVFRFLTDKPSA